MKKDLFTIVISLFLMGSAFGQKKPDSLCTHKVNYDSKGRILPWYKPEIPGAGYDKVITLASEFIKNICPNDPKTGKKLYLLHCSIYRDHLSATKFTGSPWLHNPACVYAGFVQSLVLDYRVYSGDTSYISIVRETLDHLLTKGTTPADWAWPNSPYASSDPGDPIYKGASIYDTAVTAWNKARGDGSYILEPDKIGEMGVGYLRFYQVTGEKRFLEAAINSADALVKNYRLGDTIKKHYHEKNDYTLRSPWPFRVNAKTGQVIEEYSANMIEPIRLFDELIKAKDKIGLAPEKVKRYTQIRNLVWEWMNSFEGPMKTYVWKGYFEDIRLDDQNTNRVHNIPLEVARHLIKNPEFDSDVDMTVPALMGWVKHTFKDKNMDAINEQLDCYQPMGSHTARYASIAALMYERTGDPKYKEEAYRYFNNATYSCEKDGFVRVGPTWSSEVWFSDGYSDYIKHFIEGMAAIPEWAPAGENHLLRSTSVVKSISYKPTEINYTTFYDASSEVLRLTAKPVSITVNNSRITERKDLNGEGWTWKPLDKGGVLRLKHDKGNKIKIKLK